MAGRVVPADPVAWADALDLAGADRDAFLREVASDRAAPEVSAAILRQAAPVTAGELDRLSPGLVEATARIVALEHELASVRARLRAIANLAAAEPTAEDNLAATERVQRAPTRPDYDPPPRRPYQIPLPDVQRSPDSPHETPARK